MPRHPVPRAPLLALLSAIAIAGCAGDPGTAPNGPEYVKGTPHSSTGITLSTPVLTTTTLTVGQANTADYTVTITNGRARQSLVILQGLIQQVRPSDGLAVTHGAGGTNLTCGSSSISSSGFGCFRVSEVTCLAASLRPVEFHS